MFILSWRLWVVNESPGEGVALLTKRSTPRTISPVMKPQERQNRILELLQAYQRELKVEEIAEIFAVSSLTIRRDLDALSENRSIIRTHGGCLSAGPAALHAEYHQRVALNFRLKQAIAREAIRFLKKGDAVLMNDGTTTFHVGLQVGAFGDCMIYTNSLALIAEYPRFRNTRLFLLPGEYDENRYSIRGSLTEQMLESLKFDTVFLGTEAVDEYGRCLVQAPEEAHLAGLMLRTGRKAVLVADHTKVGAGGHVTYGKLSDFNAWILSGDLPQETMETYSQMTRILVAESPEDD